MGKKGLSLEEKRQKILEIYYEKVIIAHFSQQKLERSLESERDRKVGCKKRSW